jgi:hypothetical protein
VLNVTKLLIGHRNRLTYRRSVIVDEATLKHGAARSPRRMIPRRVVAARRSILKDNTP